MVATTVAGFRPVVDSFPLKLLPQTDADQTFN